MAELYENAELVSHPGGHTPFPTGHYKDAANELATTVLNFLVNTNNNNNTTTKADSKPTEKEEEKRNTIPTDSTTPGATIVGDYDD
jgi:hypothetical protein